MHHPTLRGLLLPGLFLVQACSAGEETPTGPGPTVVSDGPNTDSSGSSGATEPPTTTIDPTGTTTADPSTDTTDPPQTTTTTTAPDPTTTTVDPTTLTTTTTDTTTTGGPAVLDYPDKRVGIFYLAWHAFAWDAVANHGAIPPHTIESVIRGGDAQFSDILLDEGLTGEAAGFHWQQEPALGFYSLYRPRPNEAAYAEPNFAPAYPDTAAITSSHAATLWNAGVDFVFADVTNLNGVDPFADTIGLRPFEVLVEEWGALRTAGTPTPQIAAWVPAMETAAPMFRALLDVYDAAAPDLILTHAGKRVMFIVDTTGNSAFPPYLAEIEARGVTPVRMWGNLGAPVLAAGVAAWMQPCMLAGQQNTLLDASVNCDQGYTTNSPIGSVVSVSRSYQIGYASLPLQAAGRLGGLTFQKQFATALAVQPDWLLINSWNEHIAQPQPNPYDANLGPLRRSMGVTDVNPADGSADWLWVDGYGIEYSRDFEPTVEEGNAGLLLLESCLRVWRTGATSCTDPAEACCQPAPPRTLIRSVRVKGGPMVGDHVPTADPAEVASLVNSGAFEEVCNPITAAPALCGGGTTGDGPFRLYSAAGPDRQVLMRCYSGADHFLSTDPACEGTQAEAPLGYVSTVPTSDAPRPLTRCVNTHHFHWIDGPCPNGTGEAVLGYVR